MTLEINGYILTGTPAEMRELLQMGEVKKAEPAEKKPVEKKVVRKSTAKKVDWGKAMALRKAGWSYDKIGDELKVSGVTISAHLRKMGEEHELN